MDLLNLLSHRKKIFFCIDSNGENRNLYISLFTATESDKTIFELQGAKCFFAFFNCQLYYTFDA